MTEEQLNILFRSAKEAPLETSTKDVNKWIIAALVPVGFSAIMMKYFKFLLTKKGIIMTFSAIAAIGIGSTALYLSFGGTKPVTNYENIQDTITYEVQPEVILSEIDPAVSNDEQKSQLQSNELPVNLPILPLEPNNETVVELQPITTVQQKSSISINKLVLATAVNVELVQGTTENIEIKVIKGSKDMIDLVNKGGALHISMNKKANNKDVDIIIRVTVVNLKEIKMEGATQLYSSNEIECDNLELQIEGASDLNLKVIADEIKIKSEGAAEIELEGSTALLTIINSGAATVKCMDLNAETVQVDNSGAGTVKVAAESSLKINGTGASTTYYKAETKNVTITESGVPKIKKL